MYSDPDPKKMNLKDLIFHVRWVIRYVAKTGLLYDESKNHPKYLLDRRCSLCDYSNHLLKELPAGSLAKGLENLAEEIANDDTVLFHLEEYQELRDGMLLFLKKEKNYGRLTNEPYFHLSHTEQNYFSWFLQLMKFLEE